MSGVRFTNTSFVDNFGGGIHVSLGSNLGNATRPIGVAFDDVRINGTGYSGPLRKEGLSSTASTGGAEPNAVVISGVGLPYKNTGEISFKDLSIANASGGVGLIIQRVPSVGWAKLTIDGLTIRDVGYNSRESMLAPINVIGSFDRKALPTDVPTGGITITDADIQDGSARPFLRVVDPLGFRRIAFSGNVSNPFGCSVNAEAGDPLEDVSLAAIPPANLSVHVQCRVDSEARMAPGNAGLKSDDGGYLARGRRETQIAVESGDRSLLNLHLADPLVERGENVSGIATVSSSESGAFVLRVELADAEGRVMDRAELKTAGTAEAFELPFQLSTEWVLTMSATLQATGHFDGGAPLTSRPLNLSIIPEPLDYDDFWVNVWGGGSASSPAYFAALREANINLGHLYRDFSYDGKPYDDGTSYGNYHGADYNLRPNHDFLEDKLWFEMAETRK